MLFLVFFFLGQIKVLLEYFHLSIRFYGALKLASKSENKFCLVFLFFKVSSRSLSNLRHCLVFILLLAVKVIQFFINNILEKRFSLYCSIYLVDSRSP